jgi:hypothetical protein
MAQLFLRWLTLGNQLGADQIYEDDMAERIKARRVTVIVSLSGICC